ncbi:MAG: YebC/PmpR family DNA-binding transcriptional regulator [Acidobacteria bacterium]|nr:YebC/PmpR family DNA-binding transcriptional regulator [Acidobacteriota bacterium]MCG3192744.1 putative transcriptional regulatory protein [Thermoanaerobaculia bacterium]MCK6682285.1 YebC/PmpR family DNA-binding transcriptional regulator [Thermoanaerobaculia bacterium]
MSGHNKWSTIKHKKGAADAKRGRLFTKLIKEITMSARLGGGSIDSNARLRSAVQAARKASMPADNIDKAIKRGTGELEGVTYEEVLYEGYGPGGAAILVEAMTDNRNRTTSEIRHIFSKYGGNMASANSVAFQFSKKGYISIEKKAAQEDTLMELALEAGAEDFRSDDSEVFEITTEQNLFEPVKAKIEEKNIPTQTSELQMIPQNTIAVGDKAPGLIKLLEMLEDHDDVQKVWSNGDIEDQYLEG